MNFESLREERVGGRGKDHDLIRFQSGVLEEKLYRSRKVHGKAWKISITFQAVEFQFQIKLVQGWTQTEKQ